MIFKFPALVIFLCMPACLSVFLSKPQIPLWSREPFKGNLAFSVGFALEAKGEGDETYGFEEADLYRRSRL